MRFQSVARGLAALITVPVLASGCAFLIPENPSEPRYNTVMGERRMPQENAKMVGSGGSASGVRPAPVAPVMQQSTPQPTMEPAAPVQPVSAAPAPSAVTAMDLPPVDPNTQRIAAERMQNNAAARNVPSENTQVAASDYPSLNQIPPAPPLNGPGSDAQRLEAVRAQLERDRANAAQTTRQVRDAAASEPSMLGPNGTVPEPLMKTPAPPQSMNAPLPPPPPVYSAPAPAPMASAPAPIQMDNLPMNTAPPSAPRALEPIALRPPVAATPAPQFVASAPPPAATPTYRSMPPASGSFDPMAGATSYSGTPAGNGYLPTSRYSSYR